MTASEESPAAAPAGDRLQKTLANAGLGSRREMERWISAGRVLVNKSPAELGDRVTDSDHIEVDGRPLRRNILTVQRVLAMNKREGIHVTTRPPDGARSVFEGLPSLAAGRWISVGRLDVNSGGLLLMTNDGELANRLMHPSGNIDREYAVRVNGILEPRQLEQLRRGVTIDRSLQRFSDIRYFNGSGGNHWYHVVLMEGKNREVRRLFDSQGLSVSRLKRVRFGPIVLRSWVRSGTTVELPSGDVAELCRLAGLKHRRARRERRSPHSDAKSLLMSAVDS